MHYLFVCFMLSCMALQAAVRTDIALESKKDRCPYEIVASKSLFLEPAIQIAAMQFDDAGEKTMPYDAFFSKLGEFLASDEGKPFITDIYKTCFSEEEIKELAYIHEHPSFKKYGSEMKSVVQKQEELAYELFRTIIEAHGVSKEGFHDNTPLLPFQAEDMNAPSFDRSVDIYEQIANREYLALLKIKSHVQMRLKSLIAQMDKAICFEPFYEELQNALKKKETKEPFIRLYQEHFTKEEVQDILGFYAMPSYEKYCSKAKDIFMSTMKCVQDAGKVVMDRFGEVKSKAGDKTSCLTEVTDENINGYLQEKTKPVFFLISTKWCAPCKKIKPFVEELASEYVEDCLFLKADLDKSPKISETFKIEMIPTILFINKNGEIVEKTVGFKTKKELKASLQKILPSQS